MASALVGFALGVYAGTLLREEYHFPTNERIQRAINIFKDNEEKIEKAREEYQTQQPSDQNLTNKMD